MVQFLIPSITRYKTSTKSLNLPEAQFLHLKKGKNNDNDKVTVRMNNKSVYESH